MNYNYLNDTLTSQEYLWSGYPVAYQQPLTPKTLIETEEQVSIFTNFVQSVQDALAHKKLDGKSYYLPTEGEELVLGVDCEGISKKKNLALIQVSLKLIKE